MDKDTTHLIIKAVAAIVCAAIIAFGLKGHRYQFRTTGGYNLFDTWTGAVYIHQSQDKNWRLLKEFE